MVEPFFRSVGMALYLAALAYAWLDSVFHGEKEVFLTVYVAGVSLITLSFALNVFIDGDRMVPHRSLRMIVAFVMAPVVWGAAILRPVECCMKRK